MTDTELYGFFKSRSDIFNEMPSDALWNKITASLDSDQQKSNSKSTLSKLGLIVGLLAGLTTLVFLMQEPKKQRTKKQPKTAVESAAVGKKIVRKNDSSKVPFKRIDRPKTERALQIMYFEPQGKSTSNKNTTSEIPNILPKNEAIAIQPKPSLTPVPEIEKSIQGHVEMSKPKTEVFNNRIVVSSTKKLSKSQFDSLIQKMEKANDGASGKLLIIKAPGHKVFRKKIETTAKRDTLIKKAIPKNHIQFDTMPRKKNQ